MVVQRKGRHDHPARPKRLCEFIGGKTKRRAAPMRTGHDQPFLHPIMNQLFESPGRAKDRPACTALLQASDARMGCARASNDEALSHSANRRADPVLSKAPSTGPSPSRNAAQRHASRTERFKHQAELFQIIHDVSAAASVCADESARSAPESGAVVMTISRLIHTRQRR